MDVEEMMTKWLITYKRKFRVVLNNVGKTVNRLCMQFAV